MSKKKQEIDDLKAIIQVAVTTLQKGGVIAYPTDTVYGLGCDPFNQKAVKKIIALKKRSVTKGFILIAADFAQVAHLVKTQDVHPSMLSKVINGFCPTTWVFPATNKVPEWIKDEQNSVAIRIPQHEFSKMICREFGKPIVSTSANISSKPPLQSSAEVLKQFVDGIDYVVPGVIKGKRKPSRIINAVTGELLRNN